MILPGVATSTARFACLFLGLRITIHAGILTPDVKDACTESACSGQSLDGTMETW